jgi:hypothetical protein
MTFEEINFTPRTRNEKNHMLMNYKGLMALQWTQTQKSLKNSHQGQIKNNELILKTWKKENNKTRRKAFQQNIERRYQEDIP